MSVNLKLLDTLKFIGHLTVNFACGISQDDRIFIISDLGTFIITQKPDLSSDFSEYLCQKYILKPSTFAICENVDIDINSFVYELPKDVLYESAASVELTQNLKGATSPPPSILYAQWSEGNLVDGLYSMLGILTNLYSLELYIKSVNKSNITEYKIITNLTSKIIENRRRDFVYCTKFPPIQKMKELKKRVEYIGPTTFQWSHTLTYEGQNCAVIFVGHFHGDISVWRILSVKSCDNNTRCDFLCRYNSKMGNISAMYWHRTSENGGALCVGDSDGKISVLQIKNLEKEECSVDNEVCFFADQDRRVDKITVMTFDNFTILVAVKQCYLLVYGLDLSGQVFDFIVHNVDNFYITGITHNENIIKVLTFTGVFKELRLSIHFNKIIIDEIAIPVKFDFSGFRTHGFIESNNKILYAFIVGPCRLRNSIRGKKFVNFLLFNDVNINPLKLLLSNKSGCLRTYWDCFEALRIICLKEQRFPWLGLSSNLELDTLSLNQLKTLRLVSKISETVFGVIKRVASYEIKPFILLHYLVEIKLILLRLAKLFKERDTGRELSLFELRSIDLQVFFLKEMVASGILPKTQTGTTFIKEISHILAIANELKYPEMIQCNFCGEKLIGSTCLPPHADSRCVFTMMPIFLVPALICPLCNSLAHNEVEKTLHPVFCPYCDYPMETVNLDETIKEKMGDFEKEFVESQINSRCLGDCVQESKVTMYDLFLNLEDNDTTVVNISDEEEETQADELKHIYSKLAEISVDKSTPKIEDTLNIV